MKLATATVIAILAMAPASPALAAMYECSAVSLAKMTSGGLVVTTQSERIEVNQGFLFDDDTGVLRKRRQSPWEGYQVLQRGVADAKKGFDLVANWQGVVTLRIRVWPPEVLAKLSRGVMERRKI